MKRAKTPLSAEAADKVVATKSTASRRPLSSISAIATDRLTNPTALRWTAENARRIRSELLLEFSVKGLGELFWKLIHDESRIRKRSHKSTHLSLFSVGKRLPRNNPLLSD